MLRVHEFYYSGTDAAAGAAAAAAVSAAACVAAGSLNRKTWVGFLHSFSG